MATLDLVKIGGGKAGSVELDASVFEAPVRTHLLHAEVRRQLADRQRGTHSSKNRAGVSGGGSKPWRQKGTGRARQGTNRAPQWAGGGAVFGPVPRSHAHALPKKVRSAALRAALSLRLQESKLTVVDQLELQEYKTRRVLEILEGLGLGGGSVLIVSAERSPHLERSSRNLPGVSVLPVAGLNVYDVLRHDSLLLTREAVQGVQERLAAAPKGDAR
jgi:large subunit ribosomal protein L4